MPIKSGNKVTYAKWFEEIAAKREDMDPPLPPPKQWLEKVWLYQEVEFVYRAFWELGSSRPRGDGLAPIPYREVTGWLDENGIEDDLRDIIRHYLACMDDAFLNHHHEKSDKPDVAQE